MINVIKNGRRVTKPYLFVYYDYHQYETLTNICKNPPNNTFLKLWIRVTVSRLLLFNIFKPFVNYYCITKTKWKLWNTYFSDALLFFRHFNPYAHGHWCDHRYIPFGILHRSPFCSILLQTDCPFSRAQQ